SGSTYTVSGLTANSIFNFTVTNEAGCSSAASAEVSIVAQPLTPVISISVTTDPIRCGANGTIALNLTNVADGSYPVTHADGDFGTVAVTAGSAVLPAPAGTYTDIQIMANGCVSASGVEAVLNPSNCADISLTKVVDEGLPSYGSHVVFTLTVQNNGPNDASNVRVEEQLPDGYSFISADGLGTYANGIWTIGTLANGASASLNINARVNTSGNYNNTASVSADQDDSNVANNSASCATSPVSTSRPVAKNDDVTVDEDSQNNAIYVLQDNGHGADDFGDDGPSTGALVIISGPDNGVAEIHTNGTPNNPADDYVVYTPYAGYTGADSFSYEICDGNGDCASATVTMTVHAVNAAPVAVDDAADVQENGVLNGASLLDNDSDPDGDELVITTTPVSGPLHGSLVIHSDGTYT
ncbi:Ig-like domain-containing protein, partial [Carboxylicivirga taeanensis]|uniref:Ig-like domain-containing protein n=1 Tax=Carboxylicivirga taeanensis TaxID=1416875 RepID=UPI003F6E18C9